MEKNQSLTAPPLRFFRSRPPSAWVEPAGPPEIAGFGDMMSKLWRRKWLIAGITALIVALGVSFTLILTPRYSAEATLRVGLTSSPLTDLATSADRDGANSAMVQSEQYVLESRELAARVAKRLALDKTPEFNAALREKTFFDRYSPRKLIAALKPDKKPVRTPSMETDTLATGGLSGRNRQQERVVSALLGKIEIELLGRSRILMIKAQSEDSRLAAQIANTLGEVYLEEKVVQRAESATAANAWLSGHIKKLRADLEASERAVESYRREHSLYSSRSDTIAAQQLAALNTQVIGAQAKLAEAETRLKQARSTLNAADNGRALPEVLGSSFIQALKQQQSTIERRLAELLTNYGAKHPKILNINAEKRDIERKIRSEIANVVAGLRNEAAAAKARYEALKINLGKTKQEMGETKSESIRLNELEREAQANRAMFQQFLLRAKETDVQRDMEAVNSRIVSQAAIPGAPSFPPSNSIVLISIIGGLLIGILIAFLLEELDNTYRVDDDIERRTSLPTLAVIPRLSRRRLMNQYVLRRPTSEFSEAIRKLEMSLRLDENEGKGKVIMMASSVPNEGKSAICMSLAKLAAASGANVIIIDCDWRRPQLHAMVNEKNRTGIGELLAGKTHPEDVVYRDSSGAHIIFAGQFHAEHAQLICSRRMESLLESLAVHYDLVLIDTPPVLVASEVMHLSRLVDMAVYVVRWGHTHRDIVLKGLRNLEKMGSPIAGTVLSRVNTGRYRKYSRHPRSYGYRAPALGGAD